MPAAERPIVRRFFELLREAGFHPLEVIRSATMYGAEALGLAGEIGTVEPGSLVKNEGALSGGAILADKMFLRACSEDSCM